MIASESPGLFKPFDFALDRRSASAWKTPIAISGDIGVTWLSVEMSTSFRLTIAELTPSLPSLRATSANTRSGVATTSDFPRISRTFASYSVPARSSIHAKESTIAINPIRFDELGNLPPKAPRESADYVRALQLEHDPDRLIRSLGV